MITPGQIRAARALLRWTRQDLSDRSGVHPTALGRLEREQVHSRSDTLEALEEAFAKAGVELIADDGQKGEGARISKSRR